MEPRQDTRPVVVRPGGRSARVRAAVLDATLQLLAERGYDGTELPEIARRAGVHPTTVYRRWQTKSRLVGEAMLEAPAPLIPTPDTGALETDLLQLLTGAAALIQGAPVRALFEVLIGDGSDPAPEVAHARDWFWSVRVASAREVVDRAVARSELPPGADPETVVEYLVGPAFLRVVLMGRSLDGRDRQILVARTIAIVAGQ